MARVVRAAATSIGQILLLHEILACRRDREAVKSEPPSPYDDSKACRFASRCPHRVDACLAGEPPLIAVGEGGRLSACLRAAELAPFEGLDDGEDRLSDAYRLRLDLLRKTRNGTGGGS